MLNQNLRLAAWSALRSGTLAALLFGVGALTPAVVNAETMPAAPRAYFNDYTGQIPAQLSQALNQRLQGYERESSNQLLVAIYDRMDSTSSVQDYTYRVAESWRVGQSDRNNGAVLFVFLGDREMFIQVGYGLEGALPDALAKRIIEESIIPYFRTGDIAQGMAAGVDAMIAATQGEYTGSGRANGDARRSNGRSTSVFEIIFILIIVVLSAIFRGRNRQRQIYGRGHHRTGGWMVGGGGFGGGGGGGGGSFGGGGAGGSW